MALCICWILANIFLFNALQVYGSLPIPVIYFEDNIIEDDETSITCSIPCNDCPDAELSIKGNVTFKSCSHKKGNYPNVTCILEVTKDMHEMEFTCEAQFKIQSPPKKMNIRTEPNITDCPDKLVWIEGHETSFHCKATGYPAPTVTCQQNAIIYKDGETFTAMRNMSGEYTCIAKNFDQVTKKVAVSVEYKPKVLSVKVNPPLHAKGDKVEISCEASGLPHPDYKWNTPTNDIKFSSDKRIVTIENLQETHLGNYTCSVQNNHGTDHMHKPLDFATKPKISRFTIEPSKQVLEGENVTLTCEASGFPSPNLSWDTPKPGMALSQDKRTVRIWGVKKGHEGSYSCTAQNKYGSHTKTEQLSLAVKPKISQIKVYPSTAVAEGANVTLTCEATGDPLPTFTWVTPNAQLSSNTNVINISKAKKIHEGAYQCKVENRFGQDTSTVIISVEVTIGNRGERLQPVIVTILVTLIFLFYYLL